MIYRQALDNVRTEIIAKITVGVWNANKIEDNLQILQQAIDKANKYDEKETPREVCGTKQ